MVDATEQRVDCVRVVNCAGMDAQADEEIVANLNGLCDVQCQVNPKICLRESAFGAIPDNFSRLVKHANRPCSVAGDVTDLIVPVLNQRDEFIGVHVADRVKRATQHLDFRRREDGKQRPAEPLAQDRDASVVLGNLIGYFDISLLSSYLEGSNNGIGVASCLAVAAVRKRRVGDDRRRRLEP